MNAARKAVDSARTKVERHTAKLAAKVATRAFKKAYAGASLNTLGYCLISTPISSTIGKGTNWLTERLFAK